MTKKNVLRLNKEFKRLYYRGKVLVHGLLVTYCMKNRLGYTRIGITASKKTGNAVRRNRARRIIKAAYLHLEPAVQSGWDIVFVSRAKTPEKKSGHIQKVMEKHFREAGILVS